jgi:hypothetical protein
MNSAPSDARRFSRTRTLVLGMLAVGTVDILWAFGNAALSGKGPIWLLQTIAGGLLHREAYEGGMATAFLGMFLHYFIAGSIVTVYYLASRKLPLLVERAWLCGPIYGIGVYLFMQLVVLPLARWGGGLNPGIGMAKALFIHMFGVGLIAALVVRRGPAPGKAQAP